MSTGNPPAGYYADPSIPGHIRYWDGTAWVAGTSRPAPEEVAEQVLASSQAGASATRGGAHAGPPAEQQGQAAPADAWRPEGQDRQQYAAQQAQPQPMQAQAQQQYVQQAQAQAQPQAQPYAQQQAQQQAAPQQYAPAAVPQQPLPQHQPQSQQPRAEQPTAEASVAPQIPESVATMVVPSAFGTRNTGVFSFPGGNPFAGLPGSPASVFTEAGEEAEVQTTVVELASPGSRILARIIDTGIAAVFSAPITGALLLFAHRHDHQYVLKLDSQATTTYTTLGMDALGIALWACALLTVIIVSIAVEGFRLGKDGQTYGKRLAGIRVVRMPDGGPLGRRSAGTRRTLLFWVLAVIPVVDIVALGGVLWGRPYRQGLHEKATSTATVKAEA